MIRAVDRTTPPPGEPTDRTAFPPFDRYRLPCGLDVRSAEWGDVPAFEVRLALRAGGEGNPLDRSGLAALVAALLDEGSTRRGGLEIALAIERLGAALSVRSDWDRAEVRIRALEEDVDEVLALLREVTLEPAFPVEEVERIRRQTLAEIDRRRDRPGRLADEAFAERLYPGTVFGHPLGGRRESVEAISREDLVDFHRQWYGLGTASLSIAGRFGGASADRIAEAFPLGSAIDIADAVPDGLASPGDAPTRRATPPILVLDRPEAAQAELRLGHVGVSRRDPDRTGLSVLNAILGGKFTSRLNLNLRERHGITYGVHSRFVDRRSAGPFVVAAALATDSVGLAVGEILGELRRLREEPVDARELVETRDYLNGVFPYTLQTATGVAARLADLAIHDLPDDEVERAQREIAATDADRLLDLARRHVRPEATAIVVEGPAGTIVRQLESFGDVETRAI